MLESQAIPGLKKKLTLAPMGSSPGSSPGTSEQMIIRVVQAKGRKDRNVMLPAEILDLLRQWWKARPTKHDAGVAREQRWLFTLVVSRSQGPSTGDDAPVWPAVQGGGESRGAAQRALSRCRAAGAKCRRLRNCQAAATAVRHVVIASARSARRVWAETRWRWTLKVLWTAACVERNFWAEPGLLNRCILRSRRRVGWCEFSARLFFHRPRSRRRSIPRSRTAALYDRKSSVTNRSGTKAYFFRSLRISFSVACLLRFDWTSTSRTSPSASTARQR